jgi:Zn finger protein HypA/HybF involved in hydrogenase expression
MNGINAIASSKSANGATIAGLGSTTGAITIKGPFMKDELYFVSRSHTMYFRIMDIRFECPHCQQRIKIDESGAGLQINCPGCQALVTIPMPAQASQPVAQQSAVQQSGGGVQPIKPGVRALPRLRAEAPDPSPAPELAPPVAVLGKPGKGGQFKCNNPNCGAVIPEVKLLQQSVAGKLSTVCPKCRGAVTQMAKPPGFFARMMGKK